MTQPAIEPRPETVGIRFVEEMQGFISFGDPDVRRASRAGRRSGTRLTVHLVIHIASKDAFAADSIQGARASGWVTCDALGGREFPVEAGTFDLFVDGVAARQKEMRYRLFFRDSVGHPLTLTGTKSLNMGPVWRVWHDTTTLPIRVLRDHVEPGGEEEAELVASGILRLSPIGFLRQLTTFRADARSVGGALVAIGRFDAFFASQLWSMYGQGGRRVVKRLRSFRNARVRG